MARKPAHEQFDTLKALQDRAFELFGRFGYEGVSIGDISLAAKLSKGALYWHFEGKEELFLSCLQRLHQIFNDYVLEPMLVETNAVQGFVAMFRGVEKLLRDPRVENGIAGYWLVPSTPETERLFVAQRDFETAAKNKIRDILDLGRRQGSIEVSDDLEDLARTIVMLLEAAILPLRHQTPDEVHQVVTVLARTLFGAYAKTDEIRKLTRGLYPL